MYILHEYAHNKCTYNVHVIMSLRTGLFTKPSSDARPHSCCLSHHTCTESTTIHTATEGIYIHVHVHVHVLCKASAHRSNYTQVPLIYIRTCTLYMYMYMCITYGWHGTYIVHVYLHVHVYMYTHISSKITNIVHIALILNRILFREHQRVTLTTRTCRLQEQSWLVVVFPLSLALT